MSKYVQRFKQDESLWYQVDSNRRTRVKVIEQNKQLTKTKVSFIEFDNSEDWVQTFNLTR